MKPFSTPEKVTYRDTRCVNTPTRSQGLTLPSGTAFMWHFSCLGIWFPRLCFQFKGEKKKRLIPYVCFCSFQTIHPPEDSLMVQLFTWLNRVKLCYWHMWFGLSKWGQNCPGFSLCFWKALPRLMLSKDGTHPLSLAKSGKLTTQYLALPWQLSNFYVCYMKFYK